MPVPLSGTGATNTSTRLRSVKVPKTHYTSGRVRRNLRQGVCEQRRATHERGQYHTFSQLKIRLALS
jgi:GH25 family lysozyme M1 (1,4-beta-N-acetylmuramidase)